VDFPVPGGLQIGVDREQTGEVSSQIITSKVKSLEGIVLTLGQELSCRVASGEKTRLLALAIH
jgi:hypothetical protein